MKDFGNLKIKTIDLINEKIQQLNLEVYQINNVKDFDQDVIQILVQDITQNNKPLDLDILIKANEIISNLLDKVDLINDPYLLEVASAGIEKEIRNKEELIKAIDQYVYIELKNQINKITEFNGYVTKYDNLEDIFWFEFFIKGQKKKISLLWSDIKFARYAVKF